MRDDFVKPKIDRQENPGALNETSERIWWLVRWIPAGIIRYFKRTLSTQTKLYLRRILGGGIARIPVSVVTVPDGRKFKVGPNIAYWCIYYTNDYEPECTALLRDLLNPGDVAVDVGANIGWYTTLFASIVGETGRVVAFEPVPSTFAALKENLQLNGMEGIVSMHRAAVGDKNGEVELHSFPDETGTDSLSSLGRQNYAVSTAPMLTLDGVLSDLKIDKVNCVKCDVEGAEMMVLNGGSALFSSEHAPLVLIELNDDTGAYFGFSRADVLRAFQAYGYDRFFIMPSPHRMLQVFAPADLVDTNMLLACKGRYAETKLQERNWTVT